MSKADFSLADTDTLLVLGVIHGQITHVYHPIDHRKSFSADVRNIMFGTKESSSEVSKAMIDDRWARTLSLGIVQESMPDVYNAPPLAAWKQLLADLCNLGAIPSERQDRAIDTIQTNVGDWQGCRVFQLEDGRLGMSSTSIIPTDVVKVGLGLDVPLVLRHAPGREGCYTVVGACYIHGSMDGEAILGPLPDGWTMQSFSGTRAYKRYLHYPTGVAQVDDPRLPKLPAHWQRIPHEVTPDDPQSIHFFENVDTGEVINHDPRMTAEALKDRGIRLETTALI